MPKVKVTMFEHEIDVPDDEIPILRQQGLLVEDSPPPAPPAVPASLVPPAPPALAE